MPLQPIQRGTHQTIKWTIFDDEGAERPFKAGEYATICFGRQTAYGSEVLSKSTAVPGEGETTVGSPIATWYLLPADGDVLKANQYQFDIWVYTLPEGYVKKAGNTCDIQVEGRVCEDP